MTKHLDAKKIQEHLDRMVIEFMTGRSERAANLYIVDVWDERQMVARRRPADKANKGHKDGGDDEVDDDPINDDYDDGLCQPVYASCGFQQSCIPS